MENSPLQKLPPEIRNNIYELVLYVPRSFKIFSRDGFHPDTGERDSGRKGLTMHFQDKLHAKAALDLTMTCKEIRTDTLPMFFHLNTFILPFSSNSHHVGQWSPQMKETYVTALTAVRTWLTTLPKRASSAIRTLYITHDGGSALAPGKRPTYWWNNARLAEKEVLHKHIDPSSIRLKVLLMASESLSVWNTAIRSTSGRYAGPCHLDEVRACQVVVYDLPTNDKKEARLAIEQTSKDQVTRIEEKAKARDCCIAILREDLLAGVESCRALMLQAVEK